MPHFPVKLAYIHSDTPYNVRVSKCLPFFAELFAETHYIGCSRGKQWNDYAALSGVTYHVSPQVVSHGGLSGLKDTLAFFRHVKAELAQIKPDVVIATNEDYVIPFATGYFRRPPFLVCDLIDSLALRISGSFRHLYPVWNALSAISKKSVDGLVEVTEERLARHKALPEHTAIIFNSPPWSEIQPRTDLPSRSIYVCGSINDGINGAETLLQAVQMLKDVYIVFAGRLHGKWLQQVFGKHPRVVNLGETTPSESLRVAKACSAIFAHYKPFTPNFVWAAPNKLFDAMMVGVPILINSDCKASLAASSFGIGLGSPYGDVSKLAQVVSQALEPSSDMRVRCRQAQQRFRSEFAWNHMKDRWSELFHKIGIPSEKAVKGWGQTRATA